MSVLTRPRSLRRTPTVPAPRPATHDGGVTTPSRGRTAGPVDRTSRRRRAALLLAALVAAVAAAVTTAAVQLTGDDPAPLAPSVQPGGATELDIIRDEMLQRRSIIADAERATDAQRDAVLTTR